MYIPKLSARKAHNLCDVQSRSSSYTQIIALVYTHHVGYARRVCDVTIPCAVWENMHVHFRPEKSENLIFSLQFLCANNLGENNFWKTLMYCVSSHTVVGAVMRGRQLSVASNPPCEHHFKCQCWKRNPQSCHAGLCLLEHAEESAVTV